MADQSNMDAANLSLSDRIRQESRAIGFDIVRIAPAVSPPGFHPLLEWISNGHHADMEWMERRKDAYRHPDGVLPGTRSVIVTALNYHNQPPPKTTARISRYAWGSEDYHSVMRRLLKQLATLLHKEIPESRTRVVTDTAPLLERDFARLAGIGWFGKNTMLISREIGSWFFLGAILTTAGLSYDAPFEQDFCGTCTKCLDACPMDAFPEPGVLDSNRCISYLTIERRDKAIPEELRSEMQDWVFGCDICQEVCPWNRFAPTKSRPEFLLREDLAALEICDLLAMNAETFIQRFQNTPLERTGRDAIVRNAAIAAGNQILISATPPLEKLQNYTALLVSEAADWALTRIHRQTNND